jgi:hypothetical protein
MELSVVEDTFDDIVDPGQDTKPKLEPNPWVPEWFYWFLLIFID